MALLAIHKSYSEVYPSKVSKRIDSTYAHTVNIIDRMEEHGIVESQKEGRKRLLTITARGEIYGETFDKMLHIDGDGVEFPNKGDSLDFLNDNEEGDQNSGELMSVES